MSDKPDALNEQIVAALRHAEQLRKEVNDSALWKHVFKKAAERANEAVTKLADVNPTDAAQILALQSDLKRYRDLRDWVINEIQFIEARADEAAAQSEFVD